MFGYKVVPKYVQTQLATARVTGTCSIAANSSDPASINLVGNPSITADTIVTPGAITGHLTNVKLASPAITGAPPVADPYASILTHTALQAGMPNTCTAGPAGTGVTVYNTDVKICGGLTIGNKQTVDLQPPASGHLTVWITDGDLDLTNTSSLLECTTCNVATGIGVTIILTKGTGGGAIVGGVSMKAGATINSLNAPNSGSFSGVLIAQDPAGPFTTPKTQGTKCKNVSSPCSTFQGGPGATLNGLVYFPKTSMDFQGTPSIGSNSCLLLVVQQVEFAGNASLKDSGCSNAGLNTVPTHSWPVALDRYC
jgi:hypothetical protein